MQSKKAVYQALDHKLPPFWSELGVDRPLVYRPAFVDQRADVYHVLDVRIAGVWLLTVFAYATDGRFGGLRSGIITAGE
ncbi:hypothetical protein FMN63_00215 [Stappia sp. BW2]|uniref:hypothetical protein n=1 Tax=Stappia sp. BW2 TaxID=2592622 RepID=UPI0011DE5ED6|nr:hypothetical protein [Stappia sp. BW2]TYC80506.1 hypothetical protein FMN63_00215 [Stappia sp. BW2]